MKKVLLLILLLTCSNFLVFAQTPCSSTRLLNEMTRVRFDTPLDTADIIPEPDKHSCITQLSPTQAAAAWRSIGSQNRHIYRYLLTDGLNIISAQGYSGVYVFKPKTNTWMIQKWSNQRLKKTKKPKRYFNPRSRSLPSPGGDFFWKWYT